MQVVIYYIHPLDDAFIGLLVASPVDGDALPALRKVLLLHHLLPRTRTVSISIVAIHLQPNHIFCPAPTSK